MTRHFVVYHNAQKMGYEAVNRFRAYTNKPLKPDIVGDSIWVVAGVGARTKQYCLACRFTVCDISKSDTAGFKYRLDGIEGTAFDPPVTLDALQWFRTFRRSQGNFSFGLREVRDEQVIRELEGLSAHYAGAGANCSTSRQSEVGV